ncbi:hypothetical protein Mp_2g18330 [Marchantia polymorpha subsp. ruderalis]|uniref:Uncharacterized protein n=1 Tax=Marchantia polymorpha TaxID=3197 RepID=A0A2R6W2B8_MARPO|nr:hypothetical protein MARPO_0177s0012 [Marchantia polymorpha]PTQ28001.1 hypothetical protein MARPO_0177s0012 [Marchantia polymorpha]BBN02814.1 hypothetical protein Mp_2g18330 [Marchantia polymorpha subsp. ruderalis]BBN02815.1 hypothetical protein Mp_2g18330 [Marchantia polymorpha subsp. ruderalis]|eukprot:PTQ28000.1 hypothetical protein MARPO_0177s0012 [Marchantia polymorpha]
MIQALQIFQKNGKIEYILQLLTRNQTLLLISIQLAKIVRQPCQTSAFLQIRNLRVLETTSRLPEALSAAQSAIYVAFGALSCQRRSETRLSQKERSRFCSGVSLRKE